MSEEPLGESENPLHESCYQLTQANLHLLVGIRDAKLEMRLVMEDNPRLETGLRVARAVAALTEAQARAKGLLE